eukprot:Gb_40346 [translate_table: standard]
MHFRLVSSPGLLGLVPRVVSAIISLSGLGDILLQETLELILEDGYGSESIFNTLTKAQDLVKKCVDVEPSIGKLQMQISLDGLAMKLNQHLQDCELLIKSGVLRESTIPRMPTRSRTISNQEAVWCTSGDILARLQIGNFVSRQKALDSLLALMQEDDNNVLIVAGQGSVPVLVHLLDSNFIEIREIDVVIVCRLAQADSCEHLLVTEGVLAPLVGLLESGSSLAKENASAALQALTQATAAGTLQNLASITEIKQNFIDKNAIPILIRLATSGIALAQEHAVDYLQNLASDDNNLKTLIVREGGIHPLLIFSDAAATPRAQEIAIGALKKLLIPIVQQIAAVAIYELASSMENKKALGEAGCTPALVKMFEAKTTTEQEGTTKALSSLLLFYNKKYPIPILLSLSNNAKCKKQMAAAGACIYLEKLAEMEVGDAKKLLEHLERGNLWNIFGRT